MDVNPYESPSIKTARLNHLRDSPFNRTKTILLRIAACGFWLASLLPVLAFVVLINHPELIQRKPNPLLEVPSATVVFVLPAMGFLFLGVASWWREGWFAILGVAAFVPISLIALWASLQA